MEVASAREPHGSDSKTFEWASSPEIAPSRPNPQPGSAPRPSRTVCPKPPKGEMSTDKSGERAAGVAAENARRMQMANLVTPPDPRCSHSSRAEISERWSLPPDRHALAAKPFSCPDSPAILQPAP